MTDLNINNLWLTVLHFCHRFQIWDPLPHRDACGELPFKIYFIFEKASAAHLWRIPMIPKYFVCVSAPASGWLMHFFVPVPHNSTSVNEYRRTYLSVWTHLAQVWKVFTQRNRNSFRACQRIFWNNQFSEKHIWGKTALCDITKGTQRRLPRAPSRVRHREGPKEHRFKQETQNWAF